MTKPLLLTEDQAAAVLEARIGAEGGTQAYASKLGISRQAVHQALKDKKIQGVIAIDLGLKLVKAYEFHQNEVDTPQERYRKARRAWREHAKNLGYWQKPGDKDG